MRITFSSYGINKQFSHTREARRLINYIVKQENKKLGGIAVIFTSNDHILKINQDFLNHHYFTDVITFASNFKGIVGGDIYISIDQVMINTGQYATRPVEELFRVIIHGVLHITGYSDENEQDRVLMRKREDHYLWKFQEMERIETDELVV